MTHTEQKNTDDRPAMAETASSSSAVQEHAGQRDMGASFKDVGYDEGRQDLSLDTDIQIRIGSHLRSVYESTLNENTPDRFLRLLEELDRNSGSKT